MIHIRHTSAATLAHRRMRLVSQCSICIALLGIGVALAASQVSILHPSASECNFTGVPFIPVETEVPAEAPRVQLPSTTITPPDIPALPTVHLQAQPVCEELELLDELEEDEEPFFETDTGLLPRLEPPQAPRNQQMANKNESELYTPPDYQDCPTPPYPRQLRYKRLQGQVGVLISISADGHPKAVEITHSSGNRQLDRHTLSWIMQHWRFRPARKGSTPVDSQVHTSISYVLHP